MTILKKVDCDGPFCEFCGDCLECYAEDICLETGEPHNKIGGFMAKLLGRAEILGKDDRTLKDVPCPEWGGKVRVQSLTGTERDQWEMACQEQKGKEKVFSTDKLREKLLSFCLVDSEGKKLFSEGDIALLAEKNAAALTRLFDVARKLNGIGIQDVEELTKNSSGDPSADSISV